jgi:2-phosphosulfolactate phosphatase
MGRDAAGTEPMPPARPSISVHLLPGLIRPGALRGGVAVVIDVLRATTVMAQALASGCRAIVPCGEIDEARAVAAALPPGTALLGGERGGLPIEGFDLGNSPDDYTPERCDGKTLVMTTTNGTRAILASLEADRVLVAGFVNLAATSRELRRVLNGPEPRPVHLVCAGTEGEVSLEDTLLAGTLHDAVSYFEERFTPAGNDEARLAMGVAVKDFEGLPRTLRLGLGGRNVERIGLGRDIDAAARVDRLDVVAELERGDPPRIVRRR